MAGVTASSRWARVNEIFLAALDRPAGPERDALVDRESAGDAGLAAEVRSLLESHEAAERHFPPPLPRVLPPDTADLPEAIGPYRIEAELGRGGMGVVYLAEDTRLRRMVALKVLAPEFAGDEERRTRLKREAVAAAALLHPNIATVFALEEFDGQVCIAMEFVEGTTLRTAIQHGPVPVPILIGHARDICRALGAAHAVGIVHRDLKPENVMVSPAGHAKILDFGIARLPPRVLDEGKPFTQPDTVVGTPGYMSPEQLDGHDVDARSDLFSLGVLLYEAATADHPFAGTTTYSTAARVIKHDPQPARSLNPRVPAALDRVIRRCLQKAPGDRYQTAQAVLEDLDRIGRERVSPAPDVAPHPAHDPAPPREPLNYRTVWRVHQYAVMAVYAALIYPLWIACKASGLGAMRLVFFAALLAAVVNGVLRVHLLFDERFNAAHVGSRIRSASPWVGRSDLAYAAALLAGAIPVAMSHTELASVLAGVGIGAAATSLFVEPSTARAAFGAKITGPGARLTPSRRDAGRTPARRQQ